MIIKNLLILTSIILLIGCNVIPKNKNSTVSNAEQLQNAIENAVPGEEIILKNGVWKDVQIMFTGEGTEGKPIIIRAETAGQVSLEGESCLKFGGKYLVVSGICFKNGYTPTEAVIEFRLGDVVANHCRVTDCVIDRYDQPQRDRADHWVEFWGRYNQLDHCNIVGKSNSGPTIIVELKGNENIKNFHQIVNNHFGPRPRKGGPHGETIQIGESSTSMSPCNTLVANNLFDRCNGEVEVVSNKSNFNEFRNNVFFKCEGSLVMRHGNYCVLDGNYFIGDEKSDNMGGIRIVGTGHWIVNNYFYNLNGQNFRSPLAIMNGIPQSSLNRYTQVTDLVVAHNTWINCKSPWQFSVGTNISQKDVLPLSEIRSAKPIRTIVANNIIYNEKGDSIPIVAYEKVDGMKFKNNIINNQNVTFENYDGLETSTIKMVKIDENIFAPENDLSDTKLYKGFDFETITKDILGNLRSKKNSVGAICQAPASSPRILDKNKYGTRWYSSENTEVESKIITASAEAGDLATKIAEASDGDVIELASGIYEIANSLNINKKIVIQSKDKENKAQIIYSGESKTPAFQMNPKGDLSLKEVVLTGKMDQYAFASLQKNMSSLYNLSIDGCEISNFNFVLKAYKESFSNEISITNSVLKNCKNGIELSEETNDNGDYNVEFLTIDQCQFNNIKSNIIDYYRGGYDESCIGGNLKLTNCSFTNCGSEEQNGILINTNGIVNVDISKNLFKNNPVKLVALLWGAKNNTHSDNEIINSGKLVVEENLKLKMMY